MMARMLEHRVGFGSAWSTSVYHGSVMILFNAIGARGAVTLAVSTGWNLCVEGQERIPSRPKARTCAVHRPGMHPTERFPERQSPGWSAVFGRAYCYRCLDQQTADRLLEALISSGDKGFWREMDAIYRAEFYGPRPRLTAESTPSAAGGLRRPEEGAEGAEDGKRKT